MPMQDPTDSRSERFELDRAQIIKFSKRNVGIGRRILGAFSRQDKNELSAVMGPASGEGFPIPRPVKWPAIMSWPPEDLRGNWIEIANSLRNAKIDLSQIDDEAELKEKKALRDKARTFIEDLIGSYAERAKLMEKLNVQNLNFINDSAVMKKIPFSVRNSFSDPLRADGEVAWASLINLESSAKISEVAIWGRNTAETMDGGVLLADKEKIRIHKFSPQAAAMLANECSARGWPEVHLKVPHEHVQQMKAACAAAQIDAIITPTYSFLLIFSLNGKKDVIHRKVPIHDFKDLVDRMHEERTGKKKDDPEEDIDLGAGPSGVGAGPAGAGPKAETPKPGPAGVPETTEPWDDTKYMKDVTPEEAAAQREDMTSQILSLKSPRVRKTPLLEENPAYKSPDADDETGPSL